MALMQRRPPEVPPLPSSVSGSDEGYPLKFKLTGSINYSLNRKEPVTFSLGKGRIAFFLNESGAVVIQTDLALMRTENHFSPPSSILEISSGETNQELRFRIGKAEVELERGQGLSFALGDITIEISLNNDGNAVIQNSLPYSSASYKAKGQAECNVELYASAADLPTP